MANSFSRISSLGQRDSQLKVSGTNFSRHTDIERDEEVLMENVFHSMLTLERRRAERSRKPFVLMLLDANLENGTAEAILKQAVNVVVASKRETDLVGWYKQGAILGIIFSEVNLEGELPITETLRGLLLGTHIGIDWIQAVGWCVALTVAGYLGSRRLFNRRAEL